MCKVPPENFMFLSYFDEFLHYKVKPTWCRTTARWSGFDSRKGQEFFAYGHHVHTGSNEYHKHCP